MLLAGLSSGNMIALGIVAGIFVAFALVVSFVAPRRNPDFPGKKGIGVFAVVCVALFAAQLTSIITFDREKDAKGAEPAANTAGGPPHKIAVQESEFDIKLPVLKTLAPGSYTFTVKNVGKIGHNLAISGPKVNGPSTTSTIAAGGTATLTVSLDRGTYKLYCSIPGHEAAGMSAKISVG